MRVAAASPKPRESRRDPGERKAEAREPDRQLPSTSTAEVPTLALWERRKPVHALPDEPRGEEDEDLLRELSKAIRGGRTRRTNPTKPAAEDAEVELTLATVPEEEDADILDVNVGEETDTEWKELQDCDPEPAPDTEAERKAPEPTERDPPAASRQNPERLVEEEVRRCLDGLRATPAAVEAPKPRTATRQTQTAICLIRPYRPDKVKGEHGPCLNCGAQDHGWQRCPRPVRRRDFCQEHNVRGRSPWVCPWPHTPDEKRGTCRKCQTRLRDGGQALYNTGCERCRLRMQRDQDRGAPCI